MTDIHYKNKLHTNNYHFHGFDINVVANSTLLEALHSRLHQFSVNNSKKIELPTNRNKLSFIYQCVPSLTDKIDKITKSSRLVFEPPKGSITYSDKDDKLLMNIDDKIGFVCDYQDNQTAIYYTPAGKENIWFLSHAAFTVPFNEKLKRLGCYALHAAGMHYNDKGVLISGTSGSGKSTLTIALLRAGFGFLSDDTTFLKECNDNINMLAFPDEIDATSNTIKFFPELSAMQYSKLKGAPKYQINPEKTYAEQLEYIWACEPHVMLFPKISKQYQSTIKPIDTDKAFLELVPNVFLTDAHASQAHLDILSALVRKCRCYQLDAGRDFDDLAKRIKDLLD